MAIVTEEYEINGVKYRRNYSDLSCYIMRDGAKYSEAIDPIEYTDRVYTETDELIEVYTEPEQPVIGMIPSVM